MKMDRMTTRLLEAFQDAQSIALALDHTEMAPGIF